MRTRASIAAAAAIAAITTGAIASGAVVIGAIACTTACAAAQAPAHPVPESAPAHAGLDQAELTKRRNDKLRQPFVTRGAWIADWDRARLAAASSGRPLLAYFTRSYAPQPACEALERGLLCDERFLALTKEVVPFLHVTSRVAGDAHQDLLREKGGTAFPWLVWMDGEGEVLTVQQERTVEALQSNLRRVREHLAAREQARKGDLEARKIVLLTGIELGAFDVEGLERLLPQVELSAAEREQVEAALTLRRAQALVQQARGRGASANAGAELAKMLAAGRVPAGMPEFWSAILAHADRAGDAALYERALAGLKQELAQSPRAMAALAAHERRLAALKLAAGVRAAAPGAAAEPPPPAPESAPAAPAPRPAPAPPSPPSPATGRGAATPTPAPTPPQVPPWPAPGRR